MTTPNGDPLVIPVGVTPAQICPALGSGATVMIFNSDTKANLFIGHSPSISQQNSLLIAPGGSALEAANSTIYGFTDSTTPPINIQISPGTSQYNLSPGQITSTIDVAGLATAIALAILNAGIPLIAAPQLLYNYVGQKSPGGTGLFGCTVYPVGANNIANTTAAENAWSTLVSSVQIRKQYYQDAGQSHIYSASNPPDFAVQTAANLGHSIVICFVPTYSTNGQAPWGVTSETLSMVQCLNSIINPIAAIGYPGIPASKVLCTIVQEPNNGGGGKPSNMAYWQLVNFHQAGIRKAGLVAGYPGVKLVHDPTCNGTKPELWYPGPPNPNWPGGPAVVDGYVVDWYGANYVGGTYPNVPRGGSTFSDVQIANQNNNPFGFGELGNRAVETGAMPTPTQLQNFLTSDAQGRSVLGITQSQLNNGHTMLYTAWYQNNGGGGNFAYTVTHANPAVFTAAGIGAQGGTFSDGAMIVLTSGAPGGFTNNQVYWIVNSNSANNTFQLSATYFGTAIASTAVGSGQCTLYGAGVIIAGSLGTTGVDARVAMLQSIAGSAGTQTDLPGGGTFVVPPLAPTAGGGYAIANGQSYDISLSVTTIGSSATPYITVTLEWFNDDSTTAVPVDTQTWTVPIGGKFGTGTVITGRGPQRGQYLQVTLDNLDTAAAIVGMEINSNGRPVQSDVWYWDAQSSVAVPTVTLANGGAPNSLSLGVVAQQTILTTASKSWLFGLYAGEAFFRFIVTGAAGTNTVHFELTPQPGSEWTTVDVFSIYLPTGSSVFQNESTGIIKLPRGPCMLTVHNGDTASVSVSAEIVAQNP